MMLKMCDQVKQNLFSWFYVAEQKNATKYL